MLRFKREKGLATGVHAEIGAILEAAVEAGGLAGKHVELLLVEAK